VESRCNLVRVAIAGSLARRYARAICKFIAGCWWASFLALKIRCAAILSRVFRLSCFLLMRSSIKKIPLLRRNKRYRSFTGILMVAEDTERRRFTVKRF